MRDVIRCLFFFSQCFCRSAVLSDCSFCNDCSCVFRWDCVSRMIACRLLVVVRFLRTSFFLHFSISFVGDRL